MIGKIVSSYKLVSLLGIGGMGNVYLGEHVQLGRKVAIKMLHPHLAANKSLQKRFRNEASAMAHLQHPNIVALHDYHESEDGLFLIMEYVEGIELDKHIKEVSGPIVEEECIRMMEQVLDAFEYAHDQGVIHRDIKPSNILLTKDGTIKVLDFGIAKLLDDKSMTKTGTQMGTVFYMSPEQVKGQPADKRSDIYALGVTLFQMSTGKVPFDNDSSEFEVYSKIVNEPLPEARSIYPGVSDKISALIQKATDKDPERRFQSCRDFKGYLIKPESTILKAFSQVYSTGEDIIDSASSSTEEGKSKNSILFLRLFLLLLASVAAVVVINKINKNNSLIENNHIDPEGGILVDEIPNYESHSEREDRSDDLVDLIKDESGHSDFDNFSSKLSSRSVNVGEVFTLSVQGGCGCEIYLPELSPLEVIDRSENILMDSSENGEEAEKNCKQVIVYKILSRNEGSFTIAPAELRCEGVTIEKTNQHLLEVRAKDQEESEIDEEDKETGYSRKLTYYIVVGSFLSLENAWEEVDKRKTDGFDQSTVLPKEDGVYRVSIITTSSEDEARKWVDRLSIQTTLLAYEGELTPVSRGKYHVIYEAFRLKESAEECMEKVKSQGYNAARILYVNNSYYVSVETFRSKTKAKQRSKEVNGLHGFVYTENQ
jgi:serine/threonine protein kinase/cell division septation protein DedD